MESCTVSQRPPELAAPPRRLQAHHTNTLAVARAAANAVAAVTTTATTATTATATRVKIA